MPSASSVLPSPRQHVLAVLEELAGGGIEREGDLLAGAIAGLLAGLGDEAQRLVRRLQVRCEAALVADIGVVAGIVQALLQRGEDLRAHADRVRNGAGADRLDHELLDVDRIVGVHAAIDDVHHRHRQRARIDAADMAIQRNAEVLGRRLRHGKRHREDRVGAQAATCSPCRRGRSGFRRSSPARSGPCRRSHRRSRLRRCRSRSARPCRRTAPGRCRAVPPPHARRWRRPTAPRRGPSRRCPARRRPRPWDCRGCRGSRGRRYRRWLAMARLRPGCGSSAAITKARPRRPRRRPWRFVPLW